MCDSKNSQHERKRDGSNAMPSGHNVPSACLLFLTILRLCPAGRLPPKLTFADACLWPITTLARTAGDENGEGPKNRDGKRVTAEWPTSALGVDIGSPKQAAKADQ